MSLTFHIHDVAAQIVTDILAHDSNLVTCSEGSLEILPFDEKIYDDLPAVIVKPMDAAPISEEQACQYDYRFEIFCLRKYVAGEKPIQPVSEWIEGIAAAIFNSTSLWDLSWGDGANVTRCHPPSIRFETRADFFFKDERVNLQVQAPIIAVSVQVYHPYAWNE